MALIRNPTPSVSVSVSTVGRNPPCHHERLLIVSRNDRCDNERTTGAVGIDRVTVDVLPDGARAEVDHLQCEGHRVTMAGNSTDADSASIAPA